GGAQRRLELAHEGARVAERRVAQPVAAEDQHGEFGEVVAGEHVDVAAVQLLGEGAEPVAVEPGRVGDAQRGHGAPASNWPGARPGPDGPAKACAMSSQASASGPIATNRRSARCRRWVTSRQKSSAGPVTCWAASAGPVGPQAHRSPDGPASSIRKASAGAGRPRTAYAKSRVRTPRCATCRSRSVGTRDTPSVSVTSW